MRSCLLGLLFVLAVPQLVSAQEPVISPDLSGKWSGYWISDKNGHNGPLNGRFTMKSDGSYRVVYTGRFAKIIPFIYMTTMQASPIDANSVQLTASQPLGPGLGTFNTTAVATPDVFDAQFSAKKDTGRFFMTRRR
jgi:hypothetical protein